MPAPGLILTLLLTICFTLSTWLQPHAINWNQSRKQSDNLLATTLGDARRMFANHFFTKADVYFHSGYYPSIFDQARTNETHIAEQAGQDKHAAQQTEEDEAKESFLGKPHDWIEKFGRNFFITEHSHLGGGTEREMLPWLRLAAELDPQQVETYTVGSYWLREHLHRPHDAEEFLRDGFRANPDSPEILFELGRLYEDDYKDPDHARNLWQLADRKLTAQQTNSAETDLGAMRQILVSLARVEEASGAFKSAMNCLQRLHDALPPERAQEREGLQKQIDELKQKLAAAPK